MILKVMLCHDILRSLLQLLYGFLVWSRVMCDGHVVRARLVDSMWWLARFKCGIL